MARNERKLASGAPPQAYEDNEPHLFQFLTSRWPLSMSPDEWCAAVRSACQRREKWLVWLLDDVGVASVADVLEQIELDWRAMKEANDESNS